MKKPPTRQRILDAAQRLIEKDGAAGLTTREIARHAGCAEGTLFKYFKTKQDIRLAVVLENAPQFREKLARIQPGRNTVAANLEEMAMAAIEFFEKLIPLATSLFADIELLKEHRKAMAAREQGPQDVFATVTAYIAGEIRLNRAGSKVNPAAAAALLLGPCFHRVFIRQAMGKSIPGGPTDREFVTALVATLAGGLILP